MEFQDKLIALRKQNGMSQEDLGNAIGVSRQTVSKWEMGQTTPEMNKLIELSKLFDISVDELLGLKSENVKTNTAQSSSNIRSGIHYEYKSKREIKGLPLVHVNVGVGVYKAKGIIAIGNIATGVIAIGVIAKGIIAIGTLAIGIFALGAFALGLAAVAGVALGGIAVGGVAIGYLAIGGVAIGVYALGGYAMAMNIGVGGYASGKIAVGDQVKGIYTFSVKQQGNVWDRNDILTCISSNLPETPRWIVKFFKMVF
ncbi:helix-turn-helix transcriptional regulator [[Clostridium] fimetarium]|uniref:DNA-binding transcriptional regulator, XRE-family HTH domain n=1 Tax=[Clostridium] fimetarium TaxID=99656 RepID=A0A1I0M7K1_9FIRM|nr:helix-turn-helix transcriptional regulator [[Clostridium] fimetarium]SEV83706.1 DNA-binding transcriptional regulator, XRE-family HTH domain [[Clostridium] fimetarium]